MNHHPLSAGPTRILSRLLQAGMLALAVTLAACGGSDSDNGTPAPPAAVEFEVISGAGACGPTGVDGCAADSAGGGGVGGDGGGGDGSAGDGAGGGLGAMRNVRVTARKPDGTVLGTAVLANNLVSLYARTYKDAFILEFADDGTNTGAYYDEATLTWIPLNGQSLHILVPKLTHHVSANPLTEAAYQWALYKYGTESALTAVRMTEANEVVRQAFNARVPASYQLSDITNYATAVSDTTVSNSLPNTHAGRFGTLLAAMPRAARTFLGSLPRPALSFMRQLVKDIRDDGIVNASGSDAEDEAYDGSLAQLLFDAILDARGDYGVTAQPAPAEVPNVCFNPALFQKGTKWSLEFLDTFDSTPSSSTLDLEVTSDNAVFQKYGPALEVKQVFTDRSGSVTSFDYLGTDLSAGITSYGNQAAVDQLPGVTFVNVVNPASVSRQFLLKPGESDTVSRTITSSYFNADGTLFTQIPPSTQTVTETTTFVGFETVTVPAGTFRNACKYVTAGSGPNDIPTTTWITSSGQGVPVRNDFGNGDFSELLPGSTVNGVAVK
jgi:hypothetical protein